MNRTASWLVHDHLLYEDLLSQCQAVGKEDWRNVDLAFSELITHLKLHMALEEEVLYPAYEAMSHVPLGPTTALREEHSKIVNLIRDLVQVIKTRNSEHVLERLAHLENRMIRHHEKEEDIFLPMASYILNASHDELLRKLDEFDASKIQRKWDI